MLTDRQLAYIAIEYMRKLGYGDQPYLVYKHTDIDRHHIHIVGSRVDENGKPLNDKFEQMCIRDRCSAEWRNRAKQLRTGN